MNIKLLVTDSANSEQLLTVVNVIANDIFFRDTRLNVFSHGSLETDDRV